MKDKVVSTIEKFNMLKNGDSVVVGVSGGADSISLLHFLINFSKDKNIKIIVAHINHCLRGEESLRDEMFVRNFCNKYNIDLYVYKVNVKEEAIKTNCGIEECARNIRYNIFSNLASKFNAKIATAHTLSDSIESSIMNMVRGCSSKGITGIPEVRKNIIRPLIYITREQVELYCKENNLCFVTDSTNLIADCTRNKIRLEIIPVLKGINPNFENTYFRMMESIKNDNKSLEKICDDAVIFCKTKDGYDINKILNLDKSIISRVIVKIILDHCNLKIETVHINNIIEKMKIGSGAITIPGNVNVVVKNQILKIEEPKKEIVNWVYKLNAPEILTETGRKFIIEIIDIEEYRNNIKFNNLLFINAIDYDKISSNSVIRNRRPKDEFTLAKRTVTKSLKKLFNEEHIPLNKRNDIAVVEDNGKILWVEGIGASKYSCVNDETKKVILIFSKECNL